MAERLSRQALYDLVWSQPIKTSFFQVRDIRCALKYWQPAISRLLAIDEKRREKPTCELLSEFVG
jgi:hypothetical protein